MRLNVFIGSVVAQQIGSQKTDVHLPMSLGVCTKSGCETQAKGVTLDANWRWVHKVGTSTNCYTGDSWDASLCPDPVTCASNCGLDGVPTSDWASPYGISSDGDQLKLGFVTKGQYGTNVGSRTYLMDTEDTYQMFKLKNKEFTFDVDVSSLPCGLNGALYFVQMDADGGKSKYPGNAAGAKYGTGYCDAQCPHDIKFINGEANSKGWEPSPTDPNSGVGHYGSCCAEMDIWEGNTVSHAYTAHPCTVDGQTRCEGVDCGDDTTGQRYDGKCDKDGCDFAPYRMGNTTFFGPGSSFMVDSTKPMTVVTQFITSDGTDAGDLVEIRRKFVQGGKVIENPVAVSGGAGHSSITADFCGSMKKDFGDVDAFTQNGGLKAMGDALDKGMVLVMSLWDDYAAHMLWLDSDYPTDKPASQPGVARGTCATTSGDPKDVEADHPDSSVAYCNLRVGDMDTTYDASRAPTCSSKVATVVV
jgi:cellulose 1,4-beta-cellobiosidase